MTDHGPHGQFEAISGSGDTPSRVLGYQRSEERVVGKGLDDGDRVGVEVEKLTAARHGRCQVPQICESQLALDVGRATSVDVG